MHNCVRACVRVRVCVCLRRLLGSSGVECLVVCCECAHIHDTVVLQFLPFNSVLFSVLLVLYCSILFNSILFYG